jgi:hypothetical protein
MYTVDENGNFITTYKGQSYNTGFLHSGSNAIFFLDSRMTGIAVCPDAEFYYCPSPHLISAPSFKERTERQSQSTSEWPNADNLFPNNPGASVVVDLAGGNSQRGFDWGWP